MDTKMHVIATAAAALLMSSAVLAQAQFVSVTNPRAETTSLARGSIASEYWTPERLRSAKPFPLPRAVPGVSVTGNEAQTLATQDAPQSADGGAPTVKVRPNRQRLFEPGAYDAEDGGIQPQDEGSLLAPYTTALSETGFASLESSYAWRTVGKLYFTVGTSNFQCSASVIQRRIIATAGHCVHQGNGSPAGWHTNFLFIPAFDSGAAPYQTWNWAYALVTTDWYNGGGAVPNAADYAMIELQDLSIGRVGDVVGWLGWQTVSLSRNHTTKLGYPCNFSNCQKMTQSMSNNFRNVAPNNVEYGSDMRGGSSGGPWVQNFNATCPAEGCGQNSGWNRIVGITSYGYVSTAPRVQGASILDNRWVTLWNQICAHRAGNCS